MRTGPRPVVRSWKFTLKEEVGGLWENVNNYVQNLLEVGHSCSRPGQAS